MRHVLRDVEGKCREMKTLGLTKDARKLLRALEDEQSKAACRRHVKHCKARVDSDANRIADETSTVNYFTHCCVTGSRKAGTFWCTCSCTKSHSLASTRIDISERKLLMNLIIPATKKHVAEKADAFESGDGRNA